MNSLLVLFLWGFIAYSTAAPSCSDEELNKCGPYDNLPWKSKIWAEGERELKSLCSEFLPTMQCREEFVKRCTESDEAKFVDYYKESVKLYEEVCDKSWSFRDEYLKNIPCINDNFMNISEKCGKMYPQHEDENICTYTFRVGECKSKQVEETCGKEGLNVYERISIPLILWAAAEICE